MEVIGKIQINTKNGPAIRTVWLAMQGAASDRGVPVIADSQEQPLGRLQRQLSPPTGSLWDGCHQSLGPCGEASIRASDPSALIASVIAIPGRRQLMLVAI